MRRDLKLEQSIKLSSNSSDYVIWHARQNQFNLSGIWFTTKWWLQRIFIGSTMVWKKFHLSQSITVNVLKHSKEEREAHLGKYRVYLKERVSILRWVSNLNCTICYKGGHIEWNRNRSISISTAWQEKKSKDSTQKGFSRNKNSCGTLYTVHIWNNGKAQWKTSEDCQNRKIDNELDAKINWGS